MSSIIALDDYNKAKEHREKYFKARRSTIDLTSKMHHEKALKHYEIAADAGNVDAMFDLAVYYASHGSLSETAIRSLANYKNDEYIKKAISYLKKAANLNHKEAIDILITHYTWDDKNEKELLIYLLKEYENGYNDDVSRIIARYESLDPNGGIEFINQHIQKNNIDLKTWRHTIDLANLYEKTTQINKRNEIYRIIASNEKYEIHNRAAYEYVGNDYYLKADYKNAVNYYKKCGILSKIKEMAKSIEGISPKEYFEYVKKSNNSFEVAKCYLEGFGTEKNLEGGFNLLKSSYENLKRWDYRGNYITAALLVPLAECYYFGKGTSQDLKEALKLFLDAEKKADVKDYDILYAICYCYYYTQDYLNAFKRLLTYTTRNGIVANWSFNLLGNCYYYGWGTSVNYTKAFDSYVKGANKNHNDCINQVGNCYYNGLGVTKNYQKAFEYYNLGYDKYKNIYCAYNLGLCYENGQGCAKDIQKAYEFYKISSENYKSGKDAVLRLQPEIDKINQQKKLKEEQQKVEELTKEIITKIKELKENQVKPVEVKTTVVDGSAKLALNELIGLTSVKKEIQELENFIKVMNMRKKRGLPVTDISKHMVFTGNPGTGKTTVARIVAQIYKENGILEKGHLIETDREGLVGQYIGETGKKTRNVIESAMGGVLFIDEAYSLIPKDSDKDYGPEAVATLLKMMEDYKNDFVVIVAGYEDEMKFFIDSNPGLKSRFTSYINFPDYTPEEMQAIFELRASKDMFEISEGAEKELLELWKQSHKYKNLGNGRCVRNVYEKVQRLQSNRIIEQNLTKDEDFIMILKEDIPLAEDIFR